jgi:DNA-binding response OmpR family regulator
MQPETMKRLIVIDDEPAIGRLVKVVAEGSGWDVTVTDCAEQFMDEVVSAEPQAVVLDLSMPKVDGVEILRFLAASKSDAKIIIISGFDARVLETAAELGSALGLSIKGTLTKPIRIADLRAAVSSLEA